MISYSIYLPVAVPVYVRVRIMPYECGQNADGHKGTKSTKRHKVFIMLFLVILCGPGGFVAKCMATKAPRALSATKFL
jgi:hypothetical protein